MSTQFRAKGDTAEIWLYDEIGGSLFSEGVTAKTFQRELSALGRVNTINLRINSPGGDVFDGLTIYNQLKAHPARVVVDIDGLAASIASVIAMAGDEIRIAANAMMMIHNPHSVAFGDSREMQRVAALLTQVRDNLADTYVARTGAMRDDVLAWMDDETWLASDAAVQLGFADAVAAEQRVSAHFGLLARYRNTPRTLRATSGETTRAASDMGRVQIQQREQRLAALLRT